MKSLIEIWPYLSDNERAVNFAFANRLLSGSRRCKKGGCRSRMTLEKDSDRIDGRIWRCTL